MQQFILRDFDFFIKNQDRLLGIFFKEMESYSTEFLVLDGIQIGEVFIGEKTRDTVSVQFGLGQIGFHAGVVVFENDDFVALFSHSPLKIQHNF